MITRHSNQRKDFIIEVKGIDSRHFIKMDRFYSFQINAGKVKINASISFKHFAELLDPTIETIPDFGIRKRDGRYELFFIIPTETIINNIKENRFHLVLDINEESKITCTLEVSRDKFMREMKLGKKEKAIVKKKVLKGRKKVPKQEMTKQEKYKKFVDNLEKEYGNRKRPINEIDDEELKIKGIRLSEPGDDRSCDNCIYFKGIKCVQHQVNTTKQHTCFRFRPFRVTYGGGFSPR